MTVTLARTRTEVEVAADVVARIFASGLLPKKPEVLARLADVACVPVADVRTAWHRIDDGRYRPPTTRPVAADVGRVKEGVPVDSDGCTRPGSEAGTEVRSLAPSSRPHAVANLRKGNDARHARKEPVAGMRHCNRCDTLKPVDQFPIKDRRTGSRRSWCDVCFRGYQKDRYLTVRQADQLRHVLSFVALDGDPMVGVQCACCRRRIKVGDDVATGPVEVLHARCAAQMEAAG